MIDCLLTNMAESLAVRLPWIDTAVGRAVKLTDAEGRHFPATDESLATAEYTHLLPDDNHNFFFFEVIEPYSVNTLNAGYRLLRFDVFLIIWLDVSTTEYADMDALRNAVFDALNSKYFRDVNIQIDKVYEQASSIFSSYDLDIIDTQYLMKPYAGFKIRLNVSQKNMCL